MRSWPAGEGRTALQICSTCVTLWTGWVRDGACDMAAIGPLPQETIEVLRGKFAAANDTTWVLGVAAREGWLRANRGYLSAMRRRGVEEMAALMEAAAIR